MFTLTPYVWRPVKMLRREREKEKRGEREREREGGGGRVGEKETEREKEREKERETHTERDKEANRQTGSALIENKKRRHTVMNIQSRRPITSYMN